MKICLTNALFLVGYNHSMATIKIYRLCNTASDATRQQSLIPLIPIVSQSHVMLSYAIFTLF